MIPMKRMMSLVMALLMALTLTAAAFAEDLSSASGDDTAVSAAEATGTGIDGTVSADDSVNADDTGLADDTAAVEEPVPPTPEEVFDAVMAKLELNWTRIPMPNEGYLKDDAQYWSFWGVQEDGTCACLTVRESEDEGYEQIGETEVYPLEAVYADYVEDLLRCIAGLEQGTAGASLKQAQVVCMAWAVCAANDFDKLELVDLQQILSEQIACLTWEEQYALTANELAVTEEVLRLTDTDEALGGEYEDAGVAEALTLFRGSDAVRASVEALLMAVFTR